jgi:hypothetical protein
MHDTKSLDFDSLRSVSESPKRFRLFFSDTTGEKKAEKITVERDQKKINFFLFFLDCTARGCRGPTSKCKHFHVRGSQTGHPSARYSRPTGTTSGFARMTVPPFGRLPRLSVPGQNKNLRPVPVRSRPPTASNCGGSVGCPSASLR